MFKKIPGESVDIKDAFTEIIDESIKQERMMVERGILPKKQSGYTAIVTAITGLTMLIVALGKENRRSSETLRTTIFQVLVAWFGKGIGFNKHDMLRVLMELPDEKDRD